MSYKHWLFTAAIIAAAGVVALNHHPAHADPAVVLPAAAYDPPEAASSETARLSGGCFWGIQGVFEHVKGVNSVYAGYTGGGAQTAVYEIVSTGATGHAESVNIIFDPKIISYGRILQIFLTVGADPTELNYQGPDSGTQYRSEIWYTTPVQQKVATAYLAQLTAAHAFGQPIVTRIDPARPFYNAEGYHQDFLVNHPDYPYIAINDQPKVAQLQALFPAFYRADPVTTVTAAK